MSQRLLISYKENILPEQDDFYDCIFTEESDWKDLIFDWLCFDVQTGLYHGPLRVFIRDEGLFELFKKEFNNLNERFSEKHSIWDVWDLKKHSQIYLNEQINERIMGVVELVKKSYSVDEFCSD